MKTTFFPFLLPLSFCSNTTVRFSNPAFTRRREKKTTIIRGRLTRKYRPPATMYFRYIACISRNRSAMIFAITEASRRASLSLSSFLPRDWNAVLESSRGKSGCSKGDRYRRDIPRRWPVYPCRAVFQHATIRWLWSRRWILRTRRIMSFSPKKGEREERGGGGGGEEKKVE